MRGRAATVLLGQPDDDARVPQLRSGVVTQVSPLLVRVGSATTAQPCAALSSYAPAAGDVVQVLVLEGDRVVLGRAADESGGRQIPSVTIPSGSTDASSASMADWLAATIDVPAWAGVAIVQTAVTGIFETSTGGLPYGLRVRLGAQTGFPANGDGPGLNKRFSVAWGESFTLAATGSLSIVVQASRVSGGALRFDASSRVTFDVTFLR